MKKISLRGQIEEILRDKILEITDEYRGVKREEGVPALGEGLIFQCAKCKWYFRYVCRLEPYFKPDEKKKRKNAGKQ